MNTGLLDALSKDIAFIERQIEIKEIEADVLKEMVSKETEKGCFVTSNQLVLDWAYVEGRIKAMKDIHSLLTSMHSMYANKEQENEN